MQIPWPQEQPVPPLPQVTGAIGVEATSFRWYLPPSKNISDPRQAPSSFFSYSIGEDH